jgi:hypothetical protein
MKSLPRLVVAVVLFAAPTAGRAQTVAELPDDKFKLLVEKTVLYTKAVNACRVVQKSYDRYAASIDMKTGPTGKEKNVEGVLDVSSAAQEIGDAGSKGSAMWPPLPNVDGSAQKLAQSVAALAPVVKNASEYYAQKKYKADAAKHGQELHAQMLPMFQQVFADELSLRRELNVVLEDVERRNLAQIEKEHGKNYDWQLRNFLNAAKTVADLLPNHADAAMIDTARYRTRFAALQAAYTEFAQYCQQHPAEVQKAVASKSADEFVAATRILRGVLDAPKPDRQVYMTKVGDLAAKYDALMAQTTTASR